MKRYYVQDVEYNSLEDAQRVLNDIESPDEARLVIVDRQLIGISEKLGKQIFKMEPEWTENN